MKITTSNFSYLEQLGLIEPTVDIDREWPTGR